MQKNPLLGLQCSVFIGKNHYLAKHSLNRHSTTCCIYMLWFVDSFGI
jgi:hypothetical protein